MPEYEETYAALIKDGEVINTIVVDPDNQEFLDLMAEKYDAVEIVGDRDRPSPGWSVTADGWEAPPQLELETSPEPLPDPEPTPDERLNGIEARLEAIARKLGV